ncbi:uncharacterized protein LOC101861943 [Aplysia californica]|uniref:Uncharacterized protein LOC101861943 n=1 Tax=Aplysia californica TaxID=6500 RepID=A0ABM0JJQ4_APLCA|nr:uncharacterized protein LOC101861943 [Aplysia californica]
MPSIRCIHVTLLVIIVTLTPACWGQQDTIDLTLVPRTHGQAVVDVAVSAIREKCIFADDFLFLRRLAYVKSKDGEDPNTYRNGFYGGIWQVSQADFQATQTANFLKGFPSKLPAAFGIDWSRVHWSDLQKPLYSGLAALFIILSKAGNMMPVSVTAQASLYSQSMGGDYTAYVNGVQELDRFYATCKAENLDIAFILDSSGSLAPSDFNLSKGFANGVVNSFNVAPDTVKVAVITFSSAVKEEFNFNRYTTTSSVGNAIMAISQLTGGTATDLALDYATNQLFTSASGSRPNAAKVAVIITDGVSRNFTLTSQAAAALKAKHVVVFAFGIGLGLYKPELSAMASAPECTHVKVLTQHSELVSVLSEMRRRSCDAATIIPTPSNATFKCGSPQTVKILPGDETTVRIQPSDGQIRVFGSFDITQPNEAKNFFDGVATAIRPLVLYLKATTAPLYLTLGAMSASADQCRGTVDVQTLVGNHLPKRGADTWCVVNRTLIECSCRLFLEKYVYREYAIVHGDVAYLSYPNPCKDDNVGSEDLCKSGSKGFHKYPFSIYHFVYCTGRHTLIEVDCPKGSYYLEEAGDCVLSTYIDRNNPCTACNLDNWYLGKLNHTIPWNRTQYVNCIYPGTCTVKSCGRYYIFDEIVQFCVPSGDGGAPPTTIGPTTTSTTTIPTTTRRTIAFTCESGPSAVNYYPYTFDPAQYIHCEPDGTAYLETCPAGTLWNQPTLSCMDPNKADGDLVG